MSDETFKLVIEIGNEAMQTSADITEALMFVVSKLNSGHDEGKIRDENGNTVGHYGTEAS